MKVGLVGGIGSNGHVRGRRSGAVERRYRRGAWSMHSLRVIWKESEVFAIEQVALLIVLSSARQHARRCGRFWKPVQK